MARRTEPLLLNEPRRFHAATDEARRGGRRVAFVPTMGALHEGHLALVHAARERVGAGGLVAVSIFVNPTQFGPSEDFARYPRQMEADVALLAKNAVDVVFAPEPAAMYGADDQTRIRVPRLGEPLCGRFRPGHFEGVATVVGKLFALAGPCVAVFGRKDYQQLRVISQMARDLFMPVEIVGLPTVRERDGLAMSSRNRYLSVGDRVRAAAIPRALHDAWERWSAGERTAGPLRALVEERVRGAADSVDYVDARDPETLGDSAAGATRVLIALAVRIAGTRLIDNIVLGEDPSPIATRSNV